MCESIGQHFFVDSFCSWNKMHKTLESATLDLVRNNKQTKKQTPNKPSVQVLKIS